MGEMAEWINDQQFYTDEVLADYETALDGADEPGFGLPIWTTQKGEKVPITEMSTSHLFNAMKMMFNGLAAEHGGNPVWYRVQWPGARSLARQVPGYAAWWVVVMLWELDRRTDIPAHYLQPLAEIREQVFGGPDRVKGSSGPRQLTAGSCPF